MSNPDCWNCKTNANVIKTPKEFNSKRKWHCEKCGYIFDAEVPRPKMEKNIPIYLNKDDGEYIKKKDLIKYLQEYYLQHAKYEAEHGDDTTGTMAVNHIMQAIGERFIEVKLEVEGEERAY